MARNRKKQAEKALVLKGWQCPVCSRVMAPTVTSCERCVGVAPVSVPTPIREAPLWPQVPRIFDPPFWYYTVPIDPGSMTWQGGAYSATASPYDTSTLRALADA